MDTELNLSDSPTLTDAELDTLVASTLEVGEQAVANYHANLIAAGFVPSI